MTRCLTGMRFHFVDNPVALVLALHALDGAGVLGANVIVLHERISFSDSGWNGSAASSTVEDDPLVLQAVAVELRDGLPLLLLDMFRTVDGPDSARTRVPASPGLRPFSTCQVKQER